MFKFLLIVKNNDDKNNDKCLVFQGESNVYTIGFIGHHKVVSTKLPAIGRQMAAQISSGNTTTRLLGKKGLTLVQVYLCF